MEIHWLNHVCGFKFFPDLFEILEGEPTHKDFQPLAARCLKLIVAGVRMIMTDRDSLRYALKLLPKLEFFFRPDVKKAVERVLSGSSPRTEEVRELPQRTRRISTDVCLYLRLFFFFSPEV